MKTQIILCLLICVCAHANEFEIVGEVQVTRTVKSPFGLKVPGEHDFHYWRSSRSVELTDQGPEATVSAPNGEHTVTCQALKINWDEKKVERELFELTFTVGQGQSVEPDQPTPPDADFAALEKITRDAVANLQDPNTAKLIKAALDSVNATGDLKAIQLEASRQVSRAFLQARTQRDWYTHWRKPVDEWINTNVKDAGGYVAALKALSRGLSPQTNKVAPAAIYRPLEIHGTQVINRAIH